MTIHHASLSYGKLASQRESMQEEELLRMLSELHAKEPYSDEDGSGNPDTEDPEATEDTTTATANTTATAATTAPNKR